MEATIDGVRVFYDPVGGEANYPLILLHGGPGLDHTYLQPWYDVLTDAFRLLYVDLRGHGRSERVDPSTVSLRAFADDVSRLAAALRLERYAVLGHSYGAFVALAHAIEHGGASHYVLSSGTASFSKTAPEIEENLARFEPVELREQVTQSWALEPTVKTAEEFDRLWRMQLPFHFARVDGEAYRRFTDPTSGTLQQMVYAPEMLAYFAANGYSIEYEERLSTITRPTLIITGAYDRTCTPRASQDLHAGIPGSELAIIPDAGHMTFAEQPDLYFAAIRDFFARPPVAGKAQ